MSDISKLTRRDFLLRGLKAAAAIAATGLIAKKFKNTAGPMRETGVEPPMELPNFSVAGISGKMAIVTGADRVKTVRRALDSIGGIGQFIGRGDRVVLKVNAGFATPPILSATTHPDLVAEVVRLCITAGAAAVTVTDNSINDPASCFELSGIAPAARGAGAAVVLPNADLFRPITLSGGTLIRDWPFLALPLAGATRLIGIAPVKGHHRAGASMIMKNWYGLLGGRRNIFHQNIHDTVKELALLVKPTLAILDGTTTMMTNGPTGGSLSDLKPTHTMIVSTDQVAADAFGATLLGLRVDDLPYITKASVEGAGTANYELLNPVKVEAS
jgi:uncharacterized protein (DUF362 family)